MRFETRGVATEYRWVDELVESPLAKLVLRETIGANGRSHPAGAAGLLRHVPSMRRPKSILGPTSRPRPGPFISCGPYAFAEAGVPAESERKPFSTLKSEVGHSTTFVPFVTVTSGLVHS